MCVASNSQQRAQALAEQKLPISKESFAETGTEAATSKLGVTSLDPLNRGRRPLVNYEGNPIRRVDSRELLGVVYHSDMTSASRWKKGVAAVANRTKTLARLRWCAWDPTQMTMKVSHQSYVESRIKWDQWPGIHFRRRN